MADSDYTEGIPNWDTGAATISPVTTPIDYIKQGYIDVNDPYSAASYGFNNDIGGPADWTGAGNLTGTPASTRAAVDQYGWYVDPYTNIFGPGTMLNANNPNVYAPAGTNITAGYTGIPVPERPSQSWIQSFGAGISDIPILGTIVDA
jgi:hypothetical protein